MKVIAAHTVKKSLSNPLTAKKVIDTFTSHDRLAIDDQVSGSELLNLVGDFAGFDAATMQSFTLPTFTKPIYDAGAGKDLDFEVLQPNEDVATIQAWYNATLATPKGSSTVTPTAVTTTSGAAVTTGSAATTTGTAATTTAAPTTTVAPTTTGGATATATAVAPPNQPRSWDPRPCS